MNAKTTLPISEGRKKIFQIAEDVQKPDVYYTFTEKGRPKAVMMSFEEFESWKETLEVMKDFPDLDKDVEKVEKDIKSGAWKKYPSLEEVMAEHGFVLADKSKKKYGAVENQARKKSQKRSGKNS